MTELAFWLGVATGVILTLVVATIALLIYLLFSGAGDIEGEEEMNELGTITPCDGSRYDEIRAAARKRSRARREAKKAAEKQQKGEKNND